MVATTYARVVKLTVTTFLMLCTLVASRAGVSFCWSGSWEVDHMLLNESCQTGAIHIPSALSRMAAGSGDTSLPLSTTPGFPTGPSNFTTMRRTHNSTAPLVMHCIIFKYLSKRSLEKGVTETTVNANFTCDHRNLCDGIGNATRLLMNVTYNGVAGDLYCCSQENCNDASVAVGLPPHQQLCYHSSNSSGTPRVVQTYCKHPASQCSQLTTAEGHSLRTQYFCDDFNVCQEHSLEPSPKLTCSQTKMSTGEREELCCCSGLLCNHPHPFSNPHPVQLPKTDDSSGQGSDWRLVVGLVLSLVFLLAVIAVLTMAYLRARQRARAENVSHVMFTYRKIVTEDSSQSNVNLLT